LACTLKPCLACGRAIPSLVHPLQLFINTDENCSARVEPDDSLFIAAYPHFNVNEMLAVNELHESVAMKTKTPIVVYNGELDRIRSGYYPALFYPKLAALNDTFLPSFDAAYYIHNFKAG
jgi:hypothetical protein